MSGARRDTYPGPAAIAPAPARRSRWHATRTLLRRLWRTVTAKIIAIGGLAAAISAILGLLPFGSDPDDPVVPQDATATIYADLRDYDVPLGQFRALPGEVYDFTAAPRHGPGVAPATLPSTVLVAAHDIAGTGDPTPDEPDPDEPDPDEPDPDEPDPDEAEPEEADEPDPDEPDQPDPDEPHPDEPDEPDPDEPDPDEPDPDEPDPDEPDPGEPPFVVEVPGGRSLELTVPWAQFVEAAPRPDPVTLSAHARLREAIADDVADALDQGADVDCDTTDCALALTPLFAVILDSLEPDARPTDAIERRQLRIAVVAEAVALFDRARRHTRHDGTWEPLGADLEVKVDVEHGTDESWVLGWQLRAAPGEPRLPTAFRHAPRWQLVVDANPYTESRALWIPLPDAPGRYVVDVWIADDDRTHDRVTVELTNPA
jgi:hypothetical protein